MHLDPASIRDTAANPEKSRDTSELELSKAAYRAAPLLRAFCPKEE